nr:MAG TPA: hypothetical protein [Caudoviricetes sp.]
MDIKSLLQNMANENGELNINEIDYTSIENEFNNEIGKVAKNVRDKERAKVEERANEISQVKVDELTQANNEASDAIINELTQRINNLENLNAENKRMSEIESFKARAKALNVDPVIVDTLINSNADVTMFNDETLKTFKKTDIIVEPKDETTNDTLDTANEAQLKSEAQRILNKFRK